MLSEHTTVASLKFVVFLLQAYVFVYVAPKLLTFEDWRRLTLHFEWLLVAVTLVALRMGSYRVGRLAGIANPNSVGLIAMMATIFMLWDATEKSSNRFYRSFCVLALIVSANALWATGSRSSMFSALAAFGVWGWSRSERRWLTMVIIASLIVVLFLDVGISNRLSDTFENRIARGGYILATRSGVWEECWRSWLERPCFGHGYGVSGINAEWSVGTSAIGMVRDGAGYAGLLESVGIFGGLSLGVVYLAAWSKIYRLNSAMPRPRDWEMSMKIASLFTALSLHAFGEPWIIAPGALAHVVFWMCFGYLKSVPEQRPISVLAKGGGATIAGSRVYAGA